MQERENMAEFLNFKGDYKGLTAESAEKKLSMYGENLFSDTRTKRLGVKQTLLDPAFLLLIIASGLYWGTPSGIACLVLAVLLAAVRIPICRYCNRRLYGRMLASEMKYRVIREEKLELVAARGLVPDDIIILQAGEIVPADAHILECDGLVIDESKVSGESMVSDKHPGADPNGKALKASCLYADSRLISGGAVCRIFATGEDTARVRIEGIAKHRDPNLTEYERAADRFILPMLLAGVLAAAAELFISIFGGAGTIEMLLSAVGHIMCFVPASAALYIRLYCVYGLKRIDAKGAAVKSLKDMEKLNGLTALVIDKSAVVSPNLLEVAGIYSKNDKLMTTVTALACAKPGALPTEQAFLLSAELTGTDIKALRENGPVAEFPYNENDKIGGNIYRIDDKYLLCVQGSVEKITGLCRMPSDEFYKVQQRAAVLSKRGLEVWASAYAIYHEGDDLPKSLYAVNYTFMGLTAYMSATRDIIPLAVQGCRRAGVKPVLVSSDSSETAVAMGKKLGLSTEGMITGDMLRIAELKGETLDFSRAEIFGNITLTQKPAIIEGLKKAGEITACIGFDDSQYDTVIRSDLGITSLDSTTGSLYEACGLIMSNDSFGGIVEVFKEARQLHRNIKKLLKLLLASAAALMTLALADIILGAGIITPMFIGLIGAAVLPVLSICYIDDTADMKYVMKPSNFLSRNTVGKSFYMSGALSGFVIGAAAAVFMFICSGIMTAGQTSAAVLILISSALSFFTLFNAAKHTGIFALINSGALSGTKALACVMATVLMIILPCIPVCGAALGFDPPGAGAIIAALVIGLACSGWYELRKYF